MKNPPTPLINPKLWERVRKSTLSLESGEKLLSEDGHFLIQGRPFSEAAHPIKNIGSIAAFGDAEIDPMFLLRHKIGATFFSSSGEFLGRLEPASKESGRLLPAISALPEDRRLHLTSRIIWGTLRQKRRVLQRPARDRGIDLGEEIQKIEWAIKAIARKTDITQVSGCLGTGNAVYYPALSQCIRVGGWAWDGRDDPTPLNSMLSFVYRLIEESVRSAIALAGLNPHVGIWRSPQQDALTKDLATELRFVADAIALRLINKRAISIKDFDGWEPSLQRLPSVVRQRITEEYRKKMSTAIALTPEIRGCYGDLPLFQALQVRSYLLGREDDFCPVSVK